MHQTIARLWQICARSVPRPRPSMAGPGPSPAVGVDNFGQRPAGQRSEFVNGPADRHQCPGRDILGNPEQFLDLVLAADVVMVVMTVPSPSPRQARTMFCTAG